MATRNRKLLLSGIFALSLALTMTGCSDANESAAPSETATAAQDDAATEIVDIDIETAAGEESQRIVDLLNAEEDTTPADWEERLHASFTEEVSVEELVDLFNQNLRPAQPFSVTNYEGGDRQAITTLTSPISDPIEMTVSLDTDSLITGLFFGPSTDG